MTEHQCFVAAIREWEDVHGYGAAHATRGMLWDWCLERGFFLPEFLRLFREKDGDGLYDHLMRHGVQLRTLLMRGWNPPLLHHACHNKPPYVRCYTWQSHGGSEMILHFSADINIGRERFDPSRRYHPSVDVGAPQIVTGLTWQTPEDFAAILLEFVRIGGEETKKPPVGRVDI